MEIVSYVLEGALRHDDSTGVGSVIRPGDVQRMSAGTGVRHSEFNASRDEPVHFLQIWIVPNVAGIDPGYEQKAYPPGELNNRLRLIASSDGRDGSVTIHQDAAIYAAKLANGATLAYRPRANRKTYVHVARGVVALNGQALSAGDGAAIESEAALNLSTPDSGEVLIFDLP